MQPIVIHRFMKNADRSQNIPVFVLVSAKQML